MSKPTSRSHQLALLTGLLAACSGAELPPTKQGTAPPPATTTVAVSASPPPDGDQRASDQVVPQAYALHLEIDPSAQRFRGRVEIDLAFATPTKRMDLHASGLDIESVTFTRGDDGNAVPARFELGVNAGLAVHLDAEVSGRGKLRFEYSANLDEIPESIYRVKAGDEWYVFTQFEAQMAREAFPCFDEPKFKTPFAVTITAPSGLTVVGNAPVLRQGTPVANVAAPEVATQGTQTVVFEPTKPIPTYLVALAIGPFERSSADLVGLGPEGKPLPHDIYTVKGKRHLTAYAAEVTHPILKSLVDYLGSPYPYPKLDQVAVPNFHSGAMENVGLVTYRENILLLDRKLASEHDRAVSRSIIAHELAHMWFGNLVTTQWWDDIWLNEAFATWMSAKVMTEVAPELETPVWAVSNMLDVMQQDASSAARPIRKVISGSKDVQNAFDGITYQKGFAVLRMLENWIGPREFQRAIQSYLGAHAWGNATMGDFVSALDAVTEAPVTEVASAFIEQAGVPLVKVTPECKVVGPGKEYLSVEFEQVRYAPLGASPLSDAAANQVWSVPVCLSWLGTGSPGPNANACTVISKVEETVPFPVRRCPTAIHPNAGERGYYHVALSPKELLDLSGRHWTKLSRQEQVGLPKHALALLQSGSIDLATYTAVLRNVSKDRHRLVIDGVVVGLFQLARIANGPAERAAVQRFATELLGPHATRLGLTPRVNEPESDKLARAAVFSALARLAPDARLESAARKLADRFFSGAKDIALDQLQLLLPVAAANGDAKFQSALLERLKEASPGERVAVIDALGSFSDPDLLRMSYQTLLGGVVLPTERRQLLNAASTSEERYAVFGEWYRKNEEGLIARSGKRALPTLPAVAWMHCSAAGRDQANAHFKDLSRFGPASATIWSEVSEGINRCIAMRERFAPEVVGALGQARR